jgi:putative transferase (TIGR04331 family)
MIKNLVISNLQFEHSKNNLYLKLFKLEQEESLTLKYHWSNKKKLKRDFYYLKTFYKKVLRFLSLELNSKHKINYSLKQWEIILGPWLMRFIEIYFDRYESVNSIKKKVKINIIDCGYFNPAPKDNQNFINLFYSKEWNYFITAEIIKDLNKKNFVRIKKNKKLKNQNFKINKKLRQF